MADLILHHYDTSPFSEKLRVVFGIKGLDWHAVDQPVIMPKPELTPLTGGYRRIPVLQIGADVYCDSQVAIAEVEARYPVPALVRPGDWAVNLWADRLWFQATVTAVFAAIGDQTPAAFMADREKLSGRPFDIAAMKAGAGVMRAQWRAQAAWIEAGVRTQPFLGGAAPSLADVAAYMNVWWLGGAVPAVADTLLAGLTGVQAWRDRMRAFGHGRRQAMTGAEALAVARAATPAAAPAHDPNDVSGLAPGAAVHVSADDYGRDPIAGRLVAVNPDRIVIARASDETGSVHVHFPRVGYHLIAAG